MIDEADVDATPAEAWLLGRARNGRIPGDALESADSDAPQRLGPGAARLLSRGLVTATANFSSLKPARTFETN